MGNNNEANQQINRMQAATNNADRNRWRKLGGKNRNFAALIALIIICFIRYVCTSQSWNYDAPSTDRITLCIYHRTSAWNDHGVFT